MHRQLRARKLSAACLAPRTTTTRLNRYATMAQRPGMPASRPSVRSMAQKTIVLVSGGNQGIGFEIVKKLSSENPNYQILLGSRDVHKGEAAASTMGAPININPIQLDVTDDASIDHCATTIEQHFGKLDVLINNAGIAGRSAGTGRQPTRKEWEEVYSTNVISCALLTDAMTPLLEKASKKARVVMISSGLGSVTNQFKRERFLDAPAYNSSKSAMNALVAHYAIKFKGWRVNACAPGHVATNLNGYSEAAGKVEDGAINACRLAVQDGEEGETGTFSTKDGPLPW